MVGIGKKGSFIMPGEMVSIKSSDGKEFSAFLARPEKANGAGIVLIQEIFGVNSHIREVAELYAADGFTVLAPDFFWRQKPGLELGYTKEDMGTGMGFATKVNAEQAVSDLHDVVKELKTKYGAKKLGSVGYCMGGTFSYLLACHNMVDAAVAYYGGNIGQNLDQAKGINIPVLMHFADKDQHITMDIVEKIEKAVADKPSVKVIVYHGVDHGFNCDQRATYDRTAAMLAFARSDCFFHKHLVG
jgi:carboxymethylenebutenolidase